MTIENQVELRRNTSNLEFVHPQEMSLIPFPENSSSGTAFLITHHPENQIDLDHIPAKIKNRMRLMESGWCGMGTCFVPPGEIVSETELSQLLATFNRINQAAGRPNDHDVLIRTGAFKDGKTIWEEPAYIYTNLDTDRKQFFTISQQPADFDRSMEKIKNVWKMIHSENFLLQRQAIHGRIYVDKQGTASMEIGTGVLHARALEKGEKITTSSIHPLGQIAHDETYPLKNCLVLGNKHDTEHVRKIFSDSPSLLSTINSFIQWVNRELQLPEFTCEFRYYTRNCHNDQRFNVMDTDIGF